MKGVGLRLPIGKIKERLRAIRLKCRPETFKAELDLYTERTLKEAMNKTPVRRPSIITAAQKRQYANRINYIPSVHHKTNPMMIVGDDGAHRVMMNGKWYRPQTQRVPAAVWSAYQELNAERNRRISHYSQADFIAYRVQARFLYRKTWWQVGLSLGLPVVASAGVQDSVTRRRPPEIPPRAYGVQRGGKNVVSYAIFNPFLAQQAAESKYANFDPQAILKSAAAKYRISFIAACERHVKRAITDSRKVA